VFSLCENYSLIYHTFEVSNKSKYYTHAKDYDYNTPTDMLVPDIFISGAF